MPQIKRSEQEKNALELVTKKIQQVDQLNRLLDSGKIILSNASRNKKEIVQIEPDGDLQRDLGDLLNKERTKIINEINKLLKKYKIELTAEELEITRMNLIDKESIEDDKEFRDSGAAPNDLTSDDGDNLLIEFD